MSTAIRFVQMASLVGGLALLSACQQKSSPQADSAKIPRPSPIAAKADSAAADSQASPPTNPRRATPLPKAGGAAEPDLAGSTGAKPSATLAAPRRAPGLPTTRATSAPDATGEFDKVPPAKTASNPGRATPGGRNRGADSVEDGGYASSPASIAELLKVDPTSREGLKPGDTLPEIVGKDLDGQEMRLSDYRGQVIMLDFWGDW